MAYKIMIDAGHGGDDPGATFQGRQEKDDNLRLAMAVGQILEDNGIDVEYTRTTDVYQTPFQKATLANQSGADFFISFHRNSSPMPNQYSGIETLVYDRSGIKYEMAQNINGAVAELGFRNLGVKERPGLVVLRRTNMPALLIETGFINTETDNRLFDERFDEIAKAIANAILGTLDMETIEQTDVSGEMESDEYFMDSESDTEFGRSPQTGRAIYPLQQERPGLQPSRPEMSGPQLTQPQRDMSRPAQPQWDMSRPQQPQWDMSRPQQPQWDMSRPQQPQWDMSRPQQPQWDMSRPQQPQWDMSRPGQPQWDMSRPQQPSQDMSRPGQWQPQQDIFGPPQWQLGWSASGQRPPGWSNSEQWQSDWSDSMRSDTDMAASQQSRPQPPSPRPPRPEPPRPGRPMPPEDMEEIFYRVQVGAYKNREYADNLVYELEDKGFPAFLIFEDGFYKVQVGAFRNLGNAIRMEQSLRNAGYSTWITT